MERGGALADACPRFFEPGVSTRDPESRYPRGDRIHTEDREALAETGIARRDQRLPLPQGRGSSRPTTCFCACRRARISTTRRGCSAPIRETWFKTPEQMAALFPDIPKPCERPSRSPRSAISCSAKSGTHLPRFPLPRRFAMRRRLSRPPRHGESPRPRRRGDRGVGERIRYELDVISR